MILQETTSTILNINSAEGVHTTFDNFETSKGEKLSKNDDATPVEPNYTTFDIQETTLKQTPPSSESETTLRPK